ncbi:MAG: hypothetical protein ACOX8E_08990, partial [Ruminococcus sp.]
PNVCLCKHGSRLSGLSRRWSLFALPSKCLPVQARQPLVGLIAPLVAVRVALQMSACASTAAACRAYRAKKWRKTCEQDKTAILPITSIFIFLRGG